MPSPPAFLTADFAQAMVSLLPRGRIWRRDPSSVIVRTLTALAPSYERSTAAAAQLLVDTLPSTTLNLLPDWEESLGLPDACAPPDPTLFQRQASVRAKWAERGGQTVAYFVRYAAALGFPITINQFKPFRVGMTVGKPLRGNDWAFTWQVIAPTASDQLVCEFTRLAPAHTILIFNANWRWLPLVSISPGVISDTDLPAITISAAVISDAVTVITGTPTVSLSAATLTFPSTTEAISSAPLAITVTNTGTAPLIITAVTASGDFSISGVTSP